MAELPEIPTSYEKVGVIVIFGALALMMAIKENNEAAAGFATTLATYFLSRQGV